MTPHASFIALDVAPRQAYANIQALAAYPGIYGPDGFFKRSIPPPARSATVTWCSTSR